MSLLKNCFVTVSLFSAAAAFAAPAVAAPVVSTASRNIDLGDTPLMGVNLSGCEFSPDGSLCPSAATVNTYIDKGFRAIRLPFRGSQIGNTVVVNKMKAAVDAAIKRNVYIILDRHDYGQTFDPDQAAWWGSFIKNFPNTTYVMIDTMNEPRKGSSYQADPSTGKSYATQVNAGIAAFRKAGFKHKLLIEWRGSSGMVRFDKRESSSKACESPACSFDRAGGLKDPLGLTMVSGHRYPDSDGSGTSPVCVTNTTGTKLIWNTDLAAKARGLKVWVGEIAFGNHAKVSATCDALGKDAIKRMRSLPDVYVGVTWWGGGNGWKEDYLYKIEPKKGTFATAAPSPYLRTITGR